MGWLASLSAGGMMALFVLLGFLNYKFGLLNKVGMGFIKKGWQMVVILVIGLLVSGYGAVAWNDLGLGGGASVTGASTSETGTEAGLSGDVLVRMAGGTVNVTTTTVDYIDDDENHMDFYVTDASIGDGEEIAFNVTIERTFISEDANILVSCEAPDKEISGVTADNLVEKTDGKIDLDIRKSGESGDQGTHVGDNQVTRLVSFSEGTGSATITVAFDQEETYHDGMTDMKTYFDVICDAEGTVFDARIKANS